MSETKLHAESRNEFGKGAARRIRRANQVPAVLYGHGTAPVHITLPGHETMLALKHGGANALLSIDLNGDSQLVLPKQVQRDPIKGFLEHLDLIIVRKGEKVVVDVPVHVVGDAAPDTLVTLENANLSLEAEATHLPDAIEVTIEGAQVGTQILAKDLKLPSGSILHADDDLLIVNVTAAPTAEEIEEELAEAEAEVGIERDESDEEQAAAAEATEDSGDGESAEGDTSSEE
jgi:large subunit ribosomal protein L25